MSSIFYEKLTEKYETPPSVPINHGDIPLSDSEKEILCLLPGFTVYDKIDKVRIETAAEVMIDKLRWEMRSKEERDGEDWDEEEEWETVREKTVYDEAGGVIDFAKQRVPDIPTCRRITVLEPRGETEEIVFANIKSRFSTATDQYMRDNCDNKGNIINQNLSKSQLDGLRSLKKRVSEEDIIITLTDKSGKLSLNTKDNYNASMEKHHRDDEKITLAEKNSIENTLNGHTLQLGRILNMGANHGHEKRVEKALRNKYCHVPVLSGLDKDHKQRQEDEPQPFHPVCGGEESNNKQMSSICSTIVTGISNCIDKKLKTLCRSTEESLEPGH